MIKNTEAFYARAREFQDKRSQLVSDYESKLESLKRFEGSQGYQEDLEKLQKEHGEALTALQGEYRTSLQTILRGMDEALMRRKVNPPTNEQLNALNLLKMRKAVTMEDLDRVFELVKDNAIATGIIQEVARDNQIKKNYLARCKEMSTGYAQDVINGMSSNLEDWLAHDTTRAGRVANEYYMRQYGTSGKLKKRTPFENQEGCFRDLAGLDQDALKLFSEAVDTE